MIELLQWLLELHWVKAVSTMLLLYWLTRVGFKMGGELWGHILAVAYAVLSYIALWSFWHGGLAPYLIYVAIVVIIIQVLSYLLWNSSRQKTPWSR